MQWHLPSAAWCLQAEATAPLPQWLLDTLDYLLSALDSGTLLQSQQPVPGQGLPSPAAACIYAGALSLCTAARLL